MRRAGKQRGLCAKAASDRFRAQTIFAQKNIFTVEPSELKVRGMELVNGITIVFVFVEEEQPSLVQRGANFGIAPSSFRRLFEVS